MNARLARPGRPRRHTAGPRAAAGALARGLAVAAALLLLAALYFALAAREGIISTNDGSHYALTRALADDGTARIDPYVNDTAIQPRRGTPTPADYRDVSFYDGHFYSDRPPGTAALAVPFYWAGRLVDRVSGRQDLDFPKLYTLMLPPLLGALTVAALYALARALGGGRGPALVTAAGGGLTTLLLKYATLLYSHIAAAAAVTAALALLLLAEGAGRPAAAPPSWRRWALAAGGVALGYGATVEYPNLLLIGPVGGYLLWRWRRGGPGGLAGGDLLAFAAGWAAPVLLLLGYHWAAFGRPWRTSYTYQYYFAWSRQLATTYVTPPWTGLRWLLFGPSGLLVITPAFAPALWGLALLARRAPARAALLAAVALTILLPTALHRTYYGGGSRDTRYLLAIVPALYAPLAVWLEAVARTRRPGGRALAALLLAAAGLWGLTRSYLSLLGMFGHAAAERPPDRALALLRDRWRDVAVVAPNLWLEHYFLTFAGPLLGLCWCGWALATWSRRRARATPPGPRPVADPVPGAARR